MQNETKPTVQDPNAETGVADERVPYSLPDLPHYTAELATLYYLSGYFGALTRAQIAVHILAGRSLGLDDICGLFDLKITPASGDTPAIVEYRTRQSYMEAGDAIEAEKTGFRKSLEPEKSEADRITPKQASPAGSNVVAMPGAENANKGPSTDPFSEKADDSVQASETTSAGHLPASAATIDEDPEAELCECGLSLEHHANGMQGHEFYTIPAELEDFVPNPKFDPTGNNAGSGVADPGKIDEPVPTIDPGLSVGAVGDETKVLIEHWRSSIVEICKQMNIDATARLEKFDDANHIEKKKIFETAKAYYLTSTNALIATVLEALKADGKATTEQQKGFFLYAGVGHDPARWKYPEAVKAEAALKQFFGGTPPKAA